MKKRVYIAGPISKGPLHHNINQGTDAFIALAKAGFAPMCPMWSAFSGRATATPEGHVIAFAGATPNALTHEDWLDIDFSWVSICHALLRLPGESKGADQEVKCAEKHGVPVFYSIDTLVSLLGAKAS